MTVQDKLDPDVVAARGVTALKGSPGVLALAVVGSVARGDARPDSDVDLLVITREPPREIRSILPQSIREHPVSLICKTPEQLEELVARGSLFLAHVREEGVVRYDPDGLLAAAFRAAAGVPLDVEGEIRRRRSALAHYRNLDRFGDNYLFALANLYGIGKGIAIARCAAMGATTFVKAGALERLAAARPDLSADIAVVQRLRPYYDVTRGHPVSALPFPYRGARAETKRAVDAVAHLAAADAP